MVAIDVPFSRNDLSLKLSLPFKYSSFKKVSVGCVNRLTLQLVRIIITINLYQLHEDVINVIPYYF